MDKVPQINLRQGKHVWFADFFGLPGLSMLPLPYVAASDRAVVREYVSKRYPQAIVF